MLGGAVCGRELLARCSCETNYLVALLARPPQRVTAVRLQFHPPHKASSLAH